MATKSCLLKYGLLTNCVPATVKLHNPQNAFWLFRGARFAKGFGLLEKLLDGPVLPHPRLIGRTIFPKRESFTTPPHQDFIPIQGTTEDYTAWFPLHDLPPDMGGLEVATDSPQGARHLFAPGR